MKIKFYLLVSAFLVIVLTLANDVKAQSKNEDANKNSFSTDTSCKQWNTNCNTTDPIWRSGNVGIGSPPVLGVALSVNQSGAPGANSTALLVSGSIVANSTGSNTLFVVNSGGGTAATFSGNVKVDGDIEVCGLSKANALKIATLSETNTLKVATLAEAQTVHVSSLLYSKEIIVKLPPFPDYVFDTSYELMPLKKLETYIEANKRLPNMPSAEEIEAKGGNIGELQVKQIEKIEELTLYIIEMNKRLEKLETENKLMKEQMASQPKK